MFKETESHFKRESMWQVTSNHSKHQLFDSTCAKPTTIIFLGATLFYSEAHLTPNQSSFLIIGDSFEQCRLVPFRLDVDDALAFVSCSHSLIV